MKDRGKWTTTERKKRGSTNHSQSVRAKLFCCDQLICQVSLVFKSNFELALWIILKKNSFFKNHFERKRITRIKACCGGA